MSASRSSHTRSSSRSASGSDLNRAGPHDAGEVTSILNNLAEIHVLCDEVAKLLGQLFEPTHEDLGSLKPLHQALDELKAEMRRRSSEVGS